MGGNAWLFRFDPILWGAILYTVYEKIGEDMLMKSVSSRWMIKTFISLILIMILASNLIVYKNYNNFNTTISSLISVIMVLLALSRNNYFYININYIKGIINWLASRSYAIFCCHITVWFIVRTLEFSNLYVSQLISIIALIILTEFSYRYFEN